MDEPEPVVITCLDCGYRGEANNVVIYEQSSEFWGAKVYEEIEEWLCPECGSNQVEE